MSEHDVTVTVFDFPQQRTGPEGTTYWVDSAGEVFSPELHSGPMTDGLGVDAEGLWIRRPQPRRRGRPPRAPERQETMPLVPSPRKQTMPDVVWVVWHIIDDQLEPVGAFADPVEALERLVDTPGGRVSRAIIQ